MKPESKQPAQEPKTAAIEPREESRAASRSRDPRLPPAGTVLQKKDRQGNIRCECVVEEGGVRFKDTFYRSLSAAAMAAAKDLGLGGQAQNGFLFWGLVKQAPREKDPVAALGHAWERYRDRAKAIVDGPISADLRHELQEMLLKQSQELACIG